MFDDKGMLTDRARGILFWFSLCMIVIVGVIAVISIFRACGSLVSQVGASLTITADRSALCPGEQSQFVVDEDVEVMWEVVGGGGTIDENGLFTAGSIPGTYTIVASEVDGRRTAEVAVQVLTCAPTPTPTPAVPLPTETPTPQTIAFAPDDSQGDILTYSGGMPAVSAPVWLDIRSASVGADLRVALQPGGVPEALAGFAGTGDALVWIVLQNPLPQPPTAELDWLFALDLDGNVATGRPAETAQTRLYIGLGVDAILALRSRGGAYEAYSYIWDAAMGDWTSGPTPRYMIDGSGTIIGLAVPLDLLSQSARVTIVPEAIRGRTGAISYALQVVDLYPDPQ